jgi:hypothetical protein
MTQRPPTAPVVGPKEMHSHQIHPLKAWATLTQTQQHTVLLTLVTMCQECLLPGEEATNDPARPLAENHPNPS